MLFAPALADRAILPKAWGSSYFFNRIGLKWSVLLMVAESRLNLPLFRCGLWDMDVCRKGFDNPAIDKDVISWHSPSIFM